LTANEHGGAAGVDPLRGPTEDEAIEACGTSREEIDRLARALAVPSGFEVDGDDWHDDDEEASTADAPRDTPEASDGSEVEVYDAFEYDDPTTAAAPKPRPTGTNQLDGDPTP
jgi:hypothetical protein